MSTTTKDILRFSHGRKCPVCGGCDEDERGQGRRCHGFVSGEWVHCSREDHAGRAKFREESRTYAHRLKGTCPCGVEHAPADPPPARRGKGERTIDTVYPYHDANGNVIFEVVRYKDPKAFAQRRPGKDTNGKPLWGLGNVEPVLYRLHELLAADPAAPVWIPEGEKDVDNLIAKGLISTCNPMGAGKWRDHYSEALRGRTCYILPDNDPAGRDHAQKVAQSLHGQAASVKIVELSALPERGDVSDFLAQGGTVDQLRELAARALEWTPRASTRRGDSRRQSRIPKPLSGKEADAFLDSVSEESPSSGSTGGTRPGASHPEEPQETPSQVLLRLAGSATLFHDPSGRAYAVVPVGNHVEVHGIRSPSFGLWLKHQFYAEESKPPSAQSFQDALGVIEARAIFDGPEEPVYIRVAGDEDRIIIDLGDAEWHVAVITADGWTVESQSPVRFRRPAGLRHLPIPERGGSIDRLKDFVNVDATEFTLFIAWLAAAFRPAGPYPILVLTGEQGSAKSTTARLGRLLLDPHKLLLRSEPKEPRDLMVGAVNNWVVALDNLSTMWGWMSDALCRLATGGGFAARTLYSDSEETFLDATRPVILTGITDFVNRGDLIDRCLFIHLSPIPEKGRRTEKEFWADFNREAPRLLGALLDAVAGGLRMLPQVTLSSLPRMADFAMFGESTSRSLGYPPDHFLDAYRDNRTGANDSALEDSPVAGMIRRLMESCQSWEGTAAELLTKLSDLAGPKLAESKHWPKSPRGMSDAVRRLAPSLRMAGIHVEFGKRQKQARPITLRLAESEGDEPSSPSPPSPAHDSPGENGDGRHGRPSSQPSTVTRPSPAPSGKIRVSDDGDEGDGSIPPLSRRLVREVF
jgi:hypothetical protein